MKNIQEAKLTEGNVAIQLLKLTLPMIIGHLGMVAFNLTDTFFVGQLGADQLAALSFTFPVVLVINSLVVGIGLGSSAIISLYVGGKEEDKVKRYSTDSLLLGLFLTIIVIAIGIFTIRPLFSLLGADGIILDYIEEYMSIWYLGMIMVVIPMIGNNIIRALGDTRVPGLIMGISATVNIILDPLFIYGLGPFPELGIKGAALATVIARTITALVAIYVLYFRERIIIFTKVKLKKIINSWKSILYIGIPNALVKMALPVGSGVIIRLLSSYGTEVVAGFGVASKIEFFAFAFTGALISVIGPFIGQNLGAKLFNRVDKGLKTGELFSMATGLFMAVIMAIFARPIARIFNNNPEVINTIVLYIRIVPISYGLQGILKIGSTILNVLTKPVHASALIVIQTFVIYIPLALAGSYLFGTAGVFASLAVSYLLSGILAHFMMQKHIKIHKQSYPHNLCE